MNIGLIWTKDINAYEQKSDPYVELMTSTKSTFGAMRLTANNADETEQSEMYVTAYNDDGTIAEARSVGGVNDEFLASEGKIIKRIGDETVFKTGWVKSNTSDNYTNIDIYYLNNINGLIAKNIKSNNTRLKCNDIYFNSILSEHAIGEFTDNIEIKEYSAYTTLAGISALALKVPKGSNIETYYADVVITLTYQLAEPVIIENVKVKYFENGVLSGGLSCFGPNTTVMQEPVVTVETKPNEYNQIQLPTDKGLIELVGCYKDNGVTMVDCLEDATLDTGTGIVTINGADITKDYFVAATIDKSNSTLGTIGMRYPI